MVAQRKSQGLISDQYSFSYNVRPTFPKYWDDLIRIEVED